MDSGFGGDADAAFGRGRAPENHKAGGQKPLDQIRILRVSGVCEQPRSIVGREADGFGAKVLE